MARYTDTVFAPIDYDHVLDRLAGGNETEVYKSDDGRYVIKLKCELGGAPEAALAHAREMRDAAERYVDCLGPRHSVPSYYLLARDNEGNVQVLVVQPYLQHARQLSVIDYDRLSVEERQSLAGELEHVISCALSHYRRNGEMPDLYGRTSAGKEERRRSRSLRNLPERIWSFVVERNLLRSHNLMWLREEGGRVVLIDYDFVRRGPLYRFVYFLTRYGLFWRDRVVILFKLRLGLD